MTLIEELSKELKNINTNNSKTTSKFLVFKRKEGTIKKELVQENVKKIISKTIENNKLAFIDGGNSTILESNDLLVCLIRVAGDIYKGKKREEIIRKEFFVIIKNRGEEIEIKLIQEEEIGEELKLELCLNQIPIDDEELKINNTIELSTIMNLCRYILEINLSKLILEKKKADYIIRDGNLMPNNSYELAALKKLDLKKVMAISKTHSLVDEEGNNINPKLMGLIKDKGFFEIMSNEDLNGLKEINCSVCKFNDKSKYLFKIDSGISKKENKEKITELELINHLSSLSNDPLFLGYPYPLVEVDELARVSNQEISLLKTKLAYNLGKNWDSFEMMTKSRDAHKVLDNK